ncbi:MAG: hypothetical protein ACJ77K_19230 [Bacteroidia bacterium]
MKKYCYIACLILAAIACKKDKKEPAPTPAATTPAAPACNFCGTYIVYQSDVKNYYTGAIITSDTSSFFDTIKQVYRPIQGWLYNLSGVFHDGSGDWSYTASTYTLLNSDNAVELLVGYQNPSVAIGDSLTITVKNPVLNTSTSVWEQEIEHSKRVN